ncbi:MAG: multidrug effflux MFS transporter [Simkaniaceae bacterium]
MLYLERKSKKMPKKPSVIILLFLVSFASVSGVLFTPGLPALQKDFQISEELAQWTMTAFLFGYAFGQLPYGPIADRFGRLKALRLGISLQMLGAISCAIFGFLGMFYSLVAARLVMGLGASVGMKISFTLVGDSFSKPKARKVTSYFLLSFAAGPALALLAGGFIVDHLGWVACFYFLFAYGLFMLLLSAFLPETLRIKTKESLTTVTKNFTKEFKNRLLILCGIMIGLNSSFVYLFATEAPFIGIRIIGLQPSIYGLFCLIPPLGMISGSLLSAYLTNFLSELKVIFLGILVQTSGILLMLSYFGMGIITPWTLFLPIPLIYIGLSMVFGNGSALAITDARQKAPASAILGFLNQIVVFFSVMLLTFIPSKQAIILPILFSCLITAIFIFWSLVAAFLAKNS